MTTEDEETEQLDLLDIGFQPREVKRRRENEAAASAEARGAASVFLERSWRRHAPEALSEVHAAVDALGEAAPTRAPAPFLPEGLSPEEAAALVRFLGGAPQRVSVAQRGDRGALVEADGRLLRVRGSEVRELAESAEMPGAATLPPSEPSPVVPTAPEPAAPVTATVPDPTPAPQPAALPPEATTQIPPQEPQAEPERKGLRGKLPFGKKKEPPAAAEPRAPEPEKAEKKGLRGKLPFGRKKE